MADIFSTLFGSMDFLAILSAMLFPIIIIVMAVTSKKKVPILLISEVMLSAIMVMVSTSALSSFYAVIAILATTFMGIMFFDRAVLSGTQYGGVTKIMLDYTLFFIIYAALVTTSGISDIQLLNFIQPQTQSPLSNCGLGLVVIDGILTCGWNIMIYIFGFISVTTAVQVINISITGSFLLFLLYYAIEVISRVR